jgi:hypothetical protein
MVDYTENAAAARPNAIGLPKTGWRAALLWGVGAALLHRLFLTLWMAGMWTLVGASLPPSANGGASVDFHNTAGLPALTSQAEQLVFGVWRRWDAVHYLDLSLNGYRAEHPGPTVFGVLTPLGIRAVDVVLPGGADLASIVFQTLAFALALTLLYRVVEVYYGDTELAPWAVAVVALLPLSHFFAAPMSESIYLAMTLGLFYFGALGRWGWAAVCGLLATGARSQGALLVGVAGLMLLEQQPPQAINRAYVVGLSRRGWPLLIIPLGAVGFTLYRSALGLPPLDEVFARTSYVFFVNPLEGIVINLRWMAENADVALRNPDSWAFVGAFALGLVMLRFKRHRRLPLLAYTFGFWLVFTTKMNWMWGTDVVYYSQSFSRYTLVLFPLAVLLADALRNGTFWGRIIGVGALLLLLLGFSAAYVLALTGP